MSRGIPALDKWQKKKHGLLIKMQPELALFNTLHFQLIITPCDYNILLR